MYKLTTIAVDLILIDYFGLSEFKGSLSSSKDCSGFIAYLDRSEYTGTLRNVTVGIEYSK